MRRGFSLIELSVVIVIIGLLVGVLVAARSIRNAAQVQAVITDFGKYKQAAIQYKEKYYYWPGDDPNAGSVWQAIQSGGVAGDGDGKIGFNSGCLNNGCLDQHETSLAFQELSLAGFITGDFINGSSSTVNVSNTYFPAAPIKIVANAQLSSPIYYYGYQTLGDTYQINKNTINISDINIYTSPAVLHLSDFDPSGAIKPSDALAIDIKIDDGAPNAGYVRGFDNPAFGIESYCLTGPTGGGSSYDVSNDSTKKCISSFAIE